MMSGPGSGRGFVPDALRRLGIRRLVLGIHASAFPPDDWDAGYGAPLSRSGERLLTFAARLGFTALQLGPSGQVSLGNLSPYDGTVFARNVWSLGIAALADREHGSLVAPDTVARLSLGHSGSARVEPERVDRVMRQVQDACQARLSALRAHHPANPIVGDFDRFRRQHAAWLDANAAYEVIAAGAEGDGSTLGLTDEALFQAGDSGAGRRARLRAARGAAFERSELAQYLCHAQQAEFRALARRAGLELWGDMQVGFSGRDRFMHQGCFVSDWLLGAPPSRTNPDGQPWGYPVLDPDQLDSPDSPALRLFELRVRKLLAEHDGVRIDHPHGLVCPWIYRADDPDAYHAVRHGARAFDTPGSLDPDLARWAIARPDDLNPAAGSPFADDRVRRIDEGQLARYSRLFDVLASICSGRDVRSVLAPEVLSTCPFPLQQVLARFGLGRFRVTQKANAADPDDVYRTERAQPEDWLMLGTHDTPPIFSAVEQWLKDGSARLRAEYLAARLVDEPSARRAAAERMAASERDLLCASLADLFASRAENVYVFVGDLFGETEPFNRAGVIHPDNWTARLPEDFEAVYASRLREGRALDLEAALRMALAGRPAPSEVPPGH